MLTELQLRNFKAWRDSGEVKLSPVTMLLGTNSSGKSSLIQSLLLLKQTALSPDRSIHLNPGGEEVHDSFDFGDFDTVLHRHADPRRFEIASSFRRPSSERVPEGSFRCAYGKTSSGAVAVQELQLSTPGLALRVTRQNKGVFSLQVNDERKPRGRSPEYAPERSIALPTAALAALGEDAARVEDLSLGIRRELEGLRYLGPWRHRPERDYLWNLSSPGDIGSDGARTMDALLASAFLREAGQALLIEGVSAWLRRMGIAEGIEVRQVGRSMRYELVIRQRIESGRRRDRRVAGLAGADAGPFRTGRQHGHSGGAGDPSAPARPIGAGRVVRGGQPDAASPVHLFRRLQTLIAQGKTDTRDCSMYFVEAGAQGAELHTLELDEFGAVANWPKHFFGDSVGEARAQVMARARRLRGAAHG